MSAEANNQKNRQAVSADCADFTRTDHISICKSQSFPKVDNRYIKNLVKKLQNPHRGIDYYLEVNALTREVLEFSEFTHPLSVLSDEISSKEWSAYFDGLVEYISTKNGIEYDGSNIKKLQHGLWSPIPIKQKSHTKYSDIFLKRGILLPEGELFWK